MAYCPCIEHHIKGGMVNAQKVEQAAVACGYFNIYRYDPRKEKPLTIDQQAPDFSKFHDFLMNEARYSQLLKINPEHAEQLYQNAQNDAKKRYEKLVKIAAE
jgi:pyruvate-ferredoxin/flavodoxin oxidoreductase